MADASLLFRRLRALLSTSPLIRSVGELHHRGKVFWAYGPDVRLRPLTDEEIGQLRAQGNVAEDWKAIWVHPSFRPDRIHQCRILGWAVFGPLRGTVAVDGVPLPTGVYRTTLRDCVLGPDVLVQDVALAARCVLARQAVLFRCGTVVGGSGSFGNGAVVHVGLTAGGRELPLVAEAPFDELAAAALDGNRSAHDELLALGREYATHLRADCTVLLPRAAILRSDKVENVLLGPGAVIDGAAHVASTTLLADEHLVARIGPGCIVRESVLQWGARVTDGAIVERTLVGEAATVARLARVCHAIIGPNSTLQQGEATSVLVGPFTAMNHEALLIAALWPDGRGNVSAGARIGSNHTGKAPDQEAFLGEGLFVGLGCAVKFPVDFSKAAYTLVAAGACLLPQRVGYPFSLILPPKHRPAGVAEGLNEIIPGWLLYASPYTVLRNELKYAGRNRAVHQAVRTELFDLRLLRAMNDAVRRLTDLDRVQADYYTEKHDPLLGKNFLVEANRPLAVAAYRTWVRRAALRALWQLLKQSSGSDLQQVLLRAAADPTVSWALEHGYVDRTMLSRDGLAAALQELLRIEHEIAVAVEQSKSREYRRGCRIMPDLYEQVHPLPSDDGVVRHCWQRVHELSDDVTRFLLTHGLATPGLRQRR